MLKVKTSTAQCQKAVSLTTAFHHHHYHSWVHLLNRHVDVTCRSFKYGTLCSFQTYFVFDQMFLQIRCVPTFSFLFYTTDVTFSNCFSIGCMLIIRSKQRFITNKTFHYTAISNIAVRKRITHNQSQQTAVPP